MRPYAASLMVPLLVALGGCVTKDASLAPSGPNDAGVTSAAIVAAMKGGLIGGPIGAGLSTAEKRQALEAEYRALEYTPAGEVVAWGESGGRSGYGEASAGPPYSVGSQNCRQYTQSVTAKGKSSSARGAACRNPDGSWTPLT